MKKSLIKRAFPGALVALILIGVSGCHMIGAHGSLYFGHGGHYGHSDYRASHRPHRSSHHHRRPGRSHSHGRHYRY